jgi:hypothetical protein
MPTPANTTERPTDSLSREERIRRRPQELYQLRGDRPGSAIDDWLRAEEEIRAAEEQTVTTTPRKTPSRQTIRDRAKRTAAG